MPWTPEQKQAHKQRMIDKYGSYENYRKHMSDLATFRPSVETIEKQMRTKKQRYGDGAFKEWGSMRGKK